MSIGNMWELEWCALTNPRHESLDGPEGDDSLYWPYLR